MSNQQEMRAYVATFRKAVVSFVAAAQTVKPSDLERDGIIQRFEFCTELAWKTLKRLLAYQGEPSGLFPREIIRACHARGVVRTPQLWEDFLSCRNTLSHVYDQARADEAFHFVVTHQQEFVQLVDAIEKSIG